MSTLLVVIASVWVGLALLFCVGLCLVAKRRPTFETVEELAYRPHRTSRRAIRPQELAAAPAK